MLQAVVRISIIALGMTLFSTAFAGSTAAQTAIETSIKMLKKEFNQNGDLRDLAVGLSVSDEKDHLHVDIYLAESAEDITAFGYRCQTSGSPCKYESSMTRCFYFAKTGFYSLDELKEASRLSSANFSDKIENFKFWQTSGRLYGQVQSLNQGNHQQSYFRCAHADAEGQVSQKALQCEKVPYSGENAP